MVQYCEKCGAQLEDDDTFCTSCGNKTVNLKVVQKAKDRKKSIKG